MELQRILTVIKATSGNTSKEKKTFTVILRPRHATMDNIFYSHLTLLDQLVPSDQLNSNKGLTESRRDRSWKQWIYAYHYAMHLKWEHESHVAYRKAVVVDSVIYNVVHNTKLWPLSFVIHNFLKKVINSLKTAPKLHYKWHNELHWR